MRSWRAVSSFAPACGLLLLAALVFGTTASGYFFIFDDYRILGNMEDESLLGLLIKPHFLYYRPVAHLFFKLQWLVFGWDSPQAYALVSVLLHALVALQLGRLMRTLGLSRTAALTAALVALLAPWTGEAVAWMSCQFDLLAALFALEAIRQGVRAVRADPTVDDNSARRARRWSLVCLGLAMGAKEIAFVTPGVWLALVVGSGATLRPRALRRWLLGALGMAVFYLGLRTGAMALASSVKAVEGGVDPWRGARGSWFELMASWDILHHLWEHAVATVMVPAEKGPPLLHVAYGLAMVGALAAGLAGRFRLTAAFVVATLLSLVPVLWIGREAGSTMGGRLVYTSTLWFAGALGVGVQVGLRAITGRPRRVVGPLLVLLAVVWSVQAVMSHRHQGRLWTVAYDLAKSGVEGFEPWLDTPDPIHVENLPYLLRQGPYVLKDYAFARYYGADRVPPLTARKRMLDARADPPIPIDPDTPFSLAPGTIRVVLPNVPR